MSALFGALGSLAESYGLARQDVMEQRQREAQAKLEEERMRQEGVRTQLEQARLKQEQALANRPMFLGSPFTRGGKQYTYKWDPDRSTITEQELGPAGESALQKVMREHHEAFPSTPLSEEEAMGIAYPQYAKAKEKMATDSGIAAMAKRNQLYGEKIPAKYAAQVAEYMDDNKMQPGVPLTMREKQTVRDLPAMEKQMAALKNMLETTGLKDENNLIWGDHSALMQHIRQWGYKLGVAPEPVTEDIFRRAGIIQVGGTVPWTIIGRSQRTVESIQFHLVKPTDTPKLLYDKLLWFQDLLNDIKAELVPRMPPDTGGEGGGTSPGIEQSTPGTALSAIHSRTNIPPASGEVGTAPGGQPQIIFNPDGSMVVR